VPAGVAGGCPCYDDNRQDLGGQMAALIAEDLEEHATPR
jgi:hypothetical protein